MISIISFFASIVWSFGRPVQAINAVINKTALVAVKESKFRSPSSPHSGCPADLETLIDQLLRDLPSYANREFLRSRNFPTNYFHNYIIVANRPQLEPLPLNLDEPIPDATEVFITTLSRQYNGSKVIEFEEYHWLFLAQSPTGWQLVGMFSQVSGYAEKSPSPPQDSSNGVIAKAIRLWLRDCQANGN
ncbi:MAG TPA: hypothetical protein VK211_04255 [Kamptonema sp.]|nr:hypothetical protein [Kamptonema sp.]